ncbi:MAG: deoxyguanosinetriphosphate triphosphohydrolase [Polynucleobacter sp.]|nr:MAG: deoxyguanosinetriphosphate triphosphohydrolase [Polynucleobacter sp.]
MTLACCAVQANASLGRVHAEPEEPTQSGRSPFQRDRDRIIHSTAFRRLEYKTQVFLNHEGDHFRNRLTHSLEVAQIGRAVARRLELNEDLVEAISLAHDLGHTPFGHAGQDALNECMKEYGGFEHNLQSLWVVDFLEERYALWDGLNLSFETREGILKHCSQKNAQTLGLLGERFLQNKQPSLEAQLANLADEIAYNNHDIDDGIRSGLLSIEQMDEVSLWRDQKQKVLNQFPQLNGRRLVFEVVRHIIHVLVDDLVKETQHRINQVKPQSVADVRNANPLVGFSEAMRAQATEMKRFLFKNLYRHPQVNQMTKEASEMIVALFHHYENHPNDLPFDFRPDDELHRRIAHYIAGMTDRYANKEFQKLIA